MAKEQTLEEILGTRVIIKLNRNPNFMALPAFLREHAPALADNLTLTEIYYRAIAVSLSGESAEKYAQLLLARLKSYGNQLSFVGPEKICELSQEVVKGMIEPIAKGPMPITSVETFEDAAKRVGKMQLDKLVLEYLGSIDPPLPKDILERYKESGAAGTLYGEVRTVVQIPAYSRLCSGPYLFHAYDLSDGREHYQDVLCSAKKGVTLCGEKLFKQEVKAEGVYPDDERAPLKIGYFITKFQGGEVINHGIPKGEDGKVPEGYCYAIVMSNTCLSALTDERNWDGKQVVELSQHIISLLRTDPHINSSGII